MLGSIESGVDFEKRILAIYQECRTPEEIDAAFRALQAEMDEQIRTRLDDTRRKLFEHFDEDVHQRLRLQLADAQAQLDRVGKRFWALTRFMLDERARFDDAALAFDLERPPRDDIPKGRYHLISKSHPRADEDGGEETEPSSSTACRTRWASMSWTARRRLPTPPARDRLRRDAPSDRISVVEALRGKGGYLTLTRLVDRLLRAGGVSALLRFRRRPALARPGDDGEALRLRGPYRRMAWRRHDSRAAVAQRLAAEAERHAQATVSRSLEQNSAHFNEAREKLEKWADDMVLSAEKALQDTKEQIKALRRQARQAVTLEEQHEIQEKIQKLERQQRRQRQEIFKVEDEIMEKRDALIDSLEKRLAQRTETETLFTIRWAVV